MASLLATNYTVVDTETTGLRQEDRAVSLALVHVEDGTIMRTHYYLLNPQRPIPPEVTEIHGITDEEVKDAPLLSAILPEIEEHCHVSQAYVAHNAPFDRRMLPGLQEKPWIDTVVLARVVYPNLDSYRNESLRVELRLDCSALQGQAHNALYDAQVTAQLFLHLLPLFLEQHPQVTNVSQLVTFLAAEKAKPRLLATCFLPKHKGEKWEDIPTDYLEWIVNQYRGNPSVILSARHHLQKRTTGAVSLPLDRNGWQAGASRRF
jgi:exodeoxyribonuclease X